jgi:ribosomal protein L11 methyltransferase
MVELRLLLPQALVEPVSDALMDELDALSVSVEDADADSEQEQALFGEPGMPVSREAWERSTLKALFAQPEAAQEAAELLAQQDWTQGLETLGIQEVPDTDWVRLTQSQFEPVCITPAFWIVPSWHQAPEQAKQVLRLDPGLAFGTGTHPTTRMCLRWIATHAECAPQWSRVLDYGCGSGILAIGAGLHGAHGIEAVDIDEAAWISTRDNALANEVKLQVGGPDLARGQYPLVLANILATPLKLLAPVLSSHVATGGHLVLAGILERQEEELIHAYAPWLKLSVQDEEDGWILMTAQRTLA